MDEAQTAMSFVWLVFIVSVITFYLLHRKPDEFKRYEFHNQSESGATTFDTYEGAKSFRRKQNFYQWLQKLVAFPIVITVFIIFFMYFMLSK
uniref:Uncharacterized protein n=1 Tax=Polynucleobacter necessarius subsp. necessarius (strain STIR1) TaxID=452638 RepID=B1XVY5_POLNS